MVERFRVDGSSGLRGRDRCGRSAHAGAAVVHDFRNMLQLATSSLGLVRRKLLEIPERELAATLEDALDALDRANLLAHQLSAPGGQKRSPEPVFLQSLVPRLRSLLSDALGDDIRLECLVAGDLRTVFCDRLQLENVLLNLAVNAKQAMLAGGTLMIEAIPCVCKEHGACVSLSVTDSGHGMPPHVAARAFEPFFSTRLLEGGTGLGLYNVRSFVEELGGSVELSTAEKRGTRFVLHLPSMSETMPWP